MHTQLQYIRTRVIRLDIGQKSWQWVSLWNFAARCWSMLRCAFIGVNDDSRIHNTLHTPLVFVSNHPQIRYLHNWVHSAIAVSKNLLIQYSTQPFVYSTVVVTKNQVIHSVFYTTFSTKCWSCHQNPLFQHILTCHPLNTTKQACIVFKGVLLSNQCTPYTQKDAILIMIQPIFRW